MDHIEISRGETRITMPRTRTLTVGGEMVGRDAVMANGRVVREEIGFRVILKAEWNWLPAKTITALHALARQGGFFTVAYPDPELGDTSAQFSLSPPESGVFKFQNGEPRWKDASLTMKAQEVI